MASDTSQLFNLLHNSLEKVARMLAANARGGARRVLADMMFLSPDTVGMGKLLALHASVGASNAGADVDLSLNPEYDVALHAVRAAVEAGSAENTTNNGGAAFNAAHVAAKLHDLDRQLSVFESKSPAAGVAGGIDLQLLLGNPVELPVPYVFKGEKGTATLRATFATDASFPTSRRVGLLISATYKRRSYRQAEAV